MVWAECRCKWLAATARQAGPFDDVVARLTPLVVVFAVQCVDAPGRAAESRRGLFVLVVEVGSACDRVEVIVMQQALLTFLGWLESLVLFRVFVRCDSARNIFGIAWLLEACLAKEGE